MLLYEISDHLPITCSINLIPDQVNYQQKLHRETDKFDEENFLDDVSDLVEKSSNHFSSTKQNITAQIDETCAQFISKFSETVNTHALLKPLSKRKSRQRKKPWMTKGIIKSISTKNKLYAKCNQKKEPDLLSHYKKYLNKLTTEKRLAKEQYCTSQLTEHQENMKKQWTIINELLT